MAFKEAKQFRCKTCLMRDSNSRCHCYPPQLVRQIKGKGASKATVVTCEHPLVADDDYCFQWVPIPTLKKEKDT